MSKIFDNLVQDVLEAYKEFHIADDAKDMLRFRKALKALDKVEGELLVNIRREAYEQVVNRKQQ